MNIIDKIISTEATRDNVRLLIPIMIYWAKQAKPITPMRILLLLQNFTI